MLTAFKTDKGRVREINEDALKVFEKEKIFIVADGVGGNNSGEIASQSAIDIVTRITNELPIPEKVSDEAIKTYLEECVKKVNEIICDMGNNSFTNKGMATTLVLCIIRNHKAYIANVGDSRAYIIRQEHFEQITEDHTYVFELYKAGIISKDEMECHEDRNKITRAVGIREVVDVDLYEIELAKDDIILLCSDGLYDEIPNAELKTIFNRNVTLQENCDNLVSLACQRGGKDNISVLCAKITEEDINE